MTEVIGKLAEIRAALAQEGLDAVRLRGVDWFSWATGGGTSVVIFTNEVGIAEVFITRNKAYILTNTIECERLRSEELPPEFEILVMPWQGTTAPDAKAEKQGDATPSDSVIAVSSSATAFANMQKLTDPKTSRIASDRPVPGEMNLPWSVAKLKLQLGFEELVRYRQLGRGAAEAMTAALKRAQSDWSEQQLAGEGAKELFARGYDPTLVMVGGERRVKIYRHPIAKSERLGDFAMMVFCARGFGLYANLTRFVFFREPTSQERALFIQLAEIEAAAFTTSLEKRPLREVYASLKSAYERLGFYGEIDKHHQGGPTGYLSREFIAGPQSPLHLAVADRTALAWNPSLIGAKMEDTVFINDRELEILTVDPEWPTFHFAGRARPDVLIKKGL